MRGPHFNEFLNAVQVVTFWTFRTTRLKKNEHKKAVNEKSSTALKVLDGMRFRAYEQKTSSISK